MTLHRVCRLLILLPLLLVAGCGASLEAYRDQGPAWDLAHFFNGKLVAHGLVTNRSGEVTSRFRVEMVGRWQDGKGELFEQFYFDDGRQQTRTWYLSRGADGHRRRASASGAHPLRSRSIYPSGQSVTGQWNPSPMGWSDAREGAVRPAL